MNNQLTRRLTLFQATAINMIDMVGIGPFVTLPVVIGLMQGPHFLYAWLAGALLSVVDATVWSELGAAFPLAGGTFNFLKESYGPNKLGKAMSFLFVWQTCIQAPLVIASAAIGFSGYLSYFYELSGLEKSAISGAVVILIIALLYRKIDDIGKISVLLWIGVLLIMGWIIGGGVINGNMAAPIRHINDNIVLNQALVAGLGAAMVKTVYSYLGYYNVCHLGGEIINPSKNIPRSMFISILCISILYIGMNIAVTSVIPWHQAIGNNYVVSSFIEIISGKNAAKVATILILYVAFASVFSATLGYSRIPYAAARDGSFFPIFAKLHPTKNFPHISLLVLGSIAFVFSLLFKIEHVITAILAMRILIQFIAQAFGLMLLHRKRAAAAEHAFTDSNFAELQQPLEMPYRMPLYPLPVILAICIWFFIFISTGIVFIISGLIVTLSGTIAYLVLSKMKGWWPFLHENNRDENTQAGAPTVSPKV